MDKLIDKIRLVKSGDDAVMMEIIEKFLPLIGKYTCKLNYDEDCKSELILKLIALVKNEIDLDKLRSDSDGAVVEYISNAIHHCYIALSKARCRIRDNETAYDRETFVELLEDNLQYAENMDDGMFMETIRAQLTEREFLYIRLIVLEGWTAEEVSKRLGVSKQAVNQCKRRALDKVKKIYICTN